MTYKNFESMPFVLTVGDIADTLAIGRNKAYDLVNSGRIKALKLGNHYRIPRENFISFLKDGVMTIA
ncbi:helix-turn-helix domain-containing protein [Flavonifractor sp. An100]|uniref:helix-turn-helix domain-containing protein n=1 Tax=Flavonifractor sp. An100 TaxID=1965538 RepID=UPI0019CF70C4|nr:helix-turn-helix domain-containing protein [Flavonifractor sp. An100]